MTADPLPSMAANDGPNLLLASIVCCTCRVRTSPNPKPTSRTVRLSSRPLYLAELHGQFGAPFGLQPDVLQWARLIKATWIKLVCLMAGQISSDAKTSVQNRTPLHHWRSGELSDPHGKSARTNIMIISSSSSSIIIMSNDGPGK